MPTQSYSGRRIAFLHHQLALGGSERVSYEAACHLQGLGLSCCFFAASYDQERWQAAGAQDFPVYLLPGAGKNTCFVSPSLDALIQYIKELSIEVLFVAIPDVVLPNRIKAETSCRIVYWLHSLPYFEAITKIESYRTQGERRWYSRLLWELVQKPRLLWSNRLVRQWQSRYLEKLRVYDAMIVLCPGYRETLIRDLALSEADAKRIFVKTNVTQPNPSPCLEKAKEIVYMGRLSRSDKRIDRLLRVWAMVQKQLPEWHLRIYGSGDKEERYLRRLAQDLRLERCTFEGFAPQPREVYQGAAILCMTSSYEGWGLVLAEGQAEGLVPIAFDVCEGIRQIMGEADKASLIKPFDLDAYAAELLRLCQDPEYYQAHQAYALQRSISLCDRERLALEWEAILNYLL